MEGAADQGTARLLTLNVQFFFLHKRCPPPSSCTQNADNAETTSMAFVCYNKQPTPGAKMSYSGDCHCVCLCCFRVDASIAPVSRQVVINNLSAFHKNMF